MLILKRRIGQSFLIDGRILVKLMAVARGSAVIGIQAPVAVPVLREEVVDKEGNGVTGHTIDTAAIVREAARLSVDHITAWFGQGMSWSMAKSMQQEIEYNMLRALDGPAKEEKATP